MSWVGIAALALLVERFFGYPKALLKRIGHPVIWMGKLITALDLHLNTAPDAPLDGKLKGAVALIVLIATVALPCLLLSYGLGTFSFGWILEVLLGTSLLAQKSLRDHVRDVHRALSFSVSAGRQAVAKIVGRDTRTLDESGVTRATLESLAENTADGVIAPVFWFALLGLPGIAVYKAVNTADSMIGHKSDRHLHFGFAAAKCDDALNFIPARITALLFALAAPSRFSATLRSAWRFAGLHRSPNAGWPEAAMAGALDLRFGGPRNYEGEQVDLPWLGDGREHLTRADIPTALALYDRSLWISLAALALLAFAL